MNPCQPNGFFDAIFGEQLATLCLSLIHIYWANDGLFGDGWHLFGIGSAEYESDMDAYAEAHIWTDALLSLIHI